MMRSLVDYYMILLLFGLESDYMTVSIGYTIANYANYLSSFSGF